MFAAHNIVSARFRSATNECCSDVILRCNSHFFKHRQPKLQGIEYLNYLIFIFLFSATYHGKSGNLFVIVMLGAALTSIRHFLFKRWGNAVAPLLLSFQKLTALLLTAFAIDQMLASFRLYFL